MTAQPLVAHSIAEAHLYLRITPCSSCHSGPLAPAETIDAENGESSHRLSIQAICTACGAPVRYEFQIFSGQVPPQLGEIDALNRTDEPSHIIDVGQWITLAHLLREDARQAPDKGKARRLELQAGACLEEALRFYDPDNDLPPREAFFGETSRRGLHDHPERYSRQHLINLKSRLPAPAADVTERLRATSSPKTPWWRKRR